MITDDKNFKETIDKDTIASNNDQKRLVMIADIIEEFDNLQKNRNVPMSKKEAHLFLIKHLNEAYYMGYKNSFDYALNK